MRVELKLLSPTAKVPTYGSAQAAGADLYADIAEAVEIAPHTTEMIPTGIAVGLPQGYFGAIYARSGLSTKEGLRPANAVGVVDADYTGPVMVALHNDSELPRTVEPGQRIAQLVVQPYIEADFDVVEELAETLRGDGGFGSSGRS